ncbi:MAG: hypothetical protein ABIH67_05540, partial [Candidatus Uhrbacteria bacterium]
MLRQTALVMVLILSLPALADEITDQELIRFVGDIEHVVCLDESLSQLDIADELRLGIEHVDALSSENAAGVLGRAISALPCNLKQIDQETLVKLFFFQGIAFYDIGDRQEATISFYRALSIEPNLVWDTNYPPDPQQIFLLAKGMTLNLPATLVSYDLTGGQILSFFFDGQGYDPSQAGTIRMRPGMHYIQYATTSGVYSKLIEIRGSELILLAPGKNIPGDQPQIRPERLGLTLGLAGIAFAHGSPYANFGLRVHLRLVQGLEVTLGAGTLLNSFYDVLSQSRWTAVMPYANLGARYRFGQNKAHPYAGAAF